MDKVEKRIKEIHDYQLKMSNKLYEVNKIPIDRLLKNQVNTSGVIFQQYCILGTPLLSDPTKTFIVKPEIKSLKWYERFWYKLCSAFRAVYQGLKP